ncbi:hypothetical protein A3715_18415 [Oleiphilus sp. HI0009]|nr:hypothetical protein A3715_18415 [Oleiphilus sp. HI0009]
MRKTLVEINKTYLFGLREIISKDIDKAKVIFSLPTALCEAIESRTCLEIDNLCEHLSVPFASTSKLNQTEKENVAAEFNNQQSIEELAHIINMKLMG